MHRTREIVLSGGHVPEQRSQRQNVQQAVLYLRVNWGKQWEPLHRR